MRPRLAMLLIAVLCAAPSRAEPPPARTGSIVGTVLDLSRVNAARTPAYARQDIRADRRFSVGRRNVTLWLEVQNLWDRVNHLQLLWDAETDRLTGIPQIGFLPIVGINVQL